MKKKKEHIPFDEETKRVLDHLSLVMRRKKRTQLSVQAALGWGRSSISQMLTGQKRPRIEALFAILGELKIEPAAFFVELYATELHAAVNLSEVEELRERVTELEARGRRLPLNDRDCLTTALDGS